MSVAVCSQCGHTLDSKEVGVCDYCAEELTSWYESEKKERGKMVYHANNLGRKYMGKVTK